MFRSLFIKIILVVIVTTFLPQCTRSQQSSSLANQGTSISRNPKMEVLRKLVEENFQSPKIISKLNDLWKVSVESSNNKCSSGRLRLKVQGVKDQSQGAEIYINFADNRRDFDIMAEWNDERTAFLFYAKSNDSEMENNINSKEFLEIVRLIIVAANVTEHEGLGLIAYYLLTWYPEERHQTLFDESLKKASVSRKITKEFYEGKAKNGLSCEVRVSKDQDGNIYSVMVNTDGNRKDRFLWLNVIPSKKIDGGACLTENMFTNTNAVVDGKRGAQWTFARNPGGHPKMFRTNFESIYHGNSKETLKIQQQASFYFTTAIGFSIGTIENTQVNLCLNNGRIEHFTVKKKAIGYGNLTVIIPVPFLGVSGATKYTADCEGLTLKSSVSLFPEAQ